VAACGSASLSRSVISSLTGRASKVLNGLSKFLMLSISTISGSTARKVVISPDMILPTEYSASDF
jgi:hypothetical protein